MKYAHLIIISLLLFTLSACGSKNEMEDANFSPHAKNTSQTSTNFDDDFGDDFDDDFGDDFDDDFDDDFNDDFDDDFNDFDDDNSISQSNDPFKTWNTFWFGFNDAMLLGFAKPLHQGYADITSVTFRNGLSNLRHNLAAPLRFCNAILQGEIGVSILEIGKFIVNICSSLGFANVIDNDTAKIPYEPDNLRFGYTLAKWGVPAGPYLVLPIIGPSTPREGFAYMVDVFTPSPTYFLPTTISLPITTVLAGNELDDAYIPYEIIVGNAFSPYIALKTAYMNNLQYNDPK